MLFNDRWMRSPFAQALHKGGSAPSYPGPSAEERELQSTQNQILRENQAIMKDQLAQQELLAPYFYKQLGLNPRFGENGKIVGFDEDPASADPNKALKAEIERGLLERSSKALKGELPVDVGLMRELNEADTKINDVLRRNLGSGYATSTPGLEAQQRQSESRNLILDAVRRGDLTTGESLSLAREGGNRALETARISDIMGVSSLRSSGVAGLGQISQMFGQQAGMMAQERSQRYGADVSAYNTKVAAGNPWMNLLGAIGGRVAGAATYKFLGS